MADATIDIVGQDDLPTIVELHNQVFRPPQDVAGLKRRCRGRYHVLQMLARLGERPVGYFLGYEGDPQTFVGLSWGVHPEFRRQGIATQMFEAVQEWSYNHHYEVVRLEFATSIRGMVHLAMELGYDITGTRWDPSRGENLVVVEKDLLRET
jgi:ribosomal protein S18 acetylase RimI-like enzyme